MFVIVENKKLNCELGEKLMVVLRRNGIFVNSPCAGAGKCGKCNVLVDGEMTLACKYAIKKDVFVEVPKNNDVFVLSDTTDNLDVCINQINEGFAVAVDVGTTTVACSLINGANGKVVAKNGIANPQKIYGADVISRLRIAREGKSNELTRLIQEAVNNLIMSCCDSKMSPEDIKMISIAGNPCMQQLFFNENIDNLINIPYKPYFVSCKIDEAKKYLAAFTESKIVKLSNPSAYVGSDTICAVLASNMLKDEISLLVDIGTNGEIFLKCHDDYYCCSTAAGPALEGNGIKFGMSATIGAIDKAYIDFGRIITHTIGDSEATGICGSGLVDAVASALKLNMINKKGKILTDNREIMLTEKIYIDQSDIRQFQLAKGAIAAGIELICKEAGIVTSEINQMYLAGAFGSYVNPCSAVSTGLIPKSISCNINQIGNGALKGACLIAINKDYYSQFDVITKKTKFIELSQLKEFSLSFGKNTEFGLD